MRIDPSAESTTLLYLHCHYRRSHSFFILFDSLLSIAFVFKGTKKCPTFEYFGTFAYIEKIFFFLLFFSDGRKGGFGHGRIPIRDLKLVPSVYLLNRSIDRVSIFLKRVSQRIYLFRPFHLKKKSEIVG